MKRIVILGSKPNPKIPGGDHIYCANGAATGNEDQVSSFARRTVIAPCGIVFRGLASNAKGDSFERARTKSICGFQGQEVIIFGGANDPRFNMVREALLDASPVGRTVTYVDQMQHRRQLRELVGMYPIVDRQLFSQPVKDIVRDAMRLAYCRFRWVLAMHENDVPAQYRPSTGVLALLNAMQEYGKGAAYTLAGIGLTQRDSYLIDGKAIQFNRVHKKPFPKHIIADTIVLKRLAGNWDISSTESDLEGLLPIVQVD